MRRLLTESVGPLRRLRWGLTLPEDIASDRGGTAKEARKSEECGIKTKSEPECVTNHFLSQINTAF